jgi:hypothetical protein
MIFACWMLNPPKHKNMAALTTPISRCNSIIATPLFLNKKAELSNQGNSAIHHRRTRGIPSLSYGRFGFFLYF